MCTTYLAAILSEKLGTTKLPRLIRLNPNIPFKTRGNGATALELEGSSTEIKRITLDLVNRYAHLQERGTNPGIAFIETLDQESSKALNQFYQRAVSELVPMKEAEEISRLVDAELYKFGNGRGIIGALAAIGSTLEDKTYELLAYRIKDSYGKEKRLEKESVLKIQKELYPEVFDSIDSETGQILITPHGYDPVFCGIRGNSIRAVEKAWDILKPGEKIERIQIFETNQGTDAHLQEKKISGLKAYDCAILNGEIIERPRTIEGGHVIFKFSDETGEIDCAAYEPTGSFREIIRKLHPGDKLRVYGGIGKYPSTLNLEKIEVLDLERIYRKEVPLCCGRKMTSSGRGKGLKCRKCGKRFNKEIPLEEIPRNLKPGFYEVPPRARRHLSKPLIRM